MNLLLSVIGPAASMIAVAFVLLVIAELACRHEDRQNVRWRVVVDWEGDRYTHEERSELAAREWAACYPVDAAVRIHEVRHDHATLVAARWAPV